MIMEANDNELKSVWMVDRHSFIQEFTLKVESLESPLKYILAESLPEWALDGKLNKVTVQMLITNTK